MEIIVHLVVQSQKKHYLGGIDYHYPKKLLLALLWVSVPIKD